MTSGKLRMGLEEFMELTPNLIKENLPERYPHVTGWTWKREDLDDSIMPKNLPGHWNSKQ
jgi:hypothetical protein